MAFYACDSRIANRAARRSSAATKRRRSIAVFGNTGGFDSLNPFVSKGTSPWQMRFWSYESLIVECHKR